MLKENDARYAPHYALALRLKLPTGKMLDRLAKKTGLTRTAVIVSALNQYAKSQGVEPEEEA
jgi:predicted transcriptional regulator